MTNSRRIAELTAAVLSGALHFATTLGLGWNGADQIVLGVGWLGYLLWRARVPGVLDGWGLRRDGLGPCAREAAIVLVVGLIACLAIGAARRTLVLDLSFLPLLLLYPLWGFVQQLIMLGIVAGNLRAMGLGRPAVIAVTAVGFAAVHVPDWPLCGATLVLGAIVCGLFLRWRNLWPLGVVHGWLGVLFYRWVLARDPWAEIVESLG